MCVLHVKTLKVKKKTLIKLLLFSSLIYYLWNATLNAVRTPGNAALLSEFVTLSRELKINTKKKYYLFYHFFFVLHIEVLHSWLDKKKHREIANDRIVSALCWPLNASICMQTRLTHTLSCADANNYSYLSSISNAWLTSLRRQNVLSQMLAYPLNIICATCNWQSNIMSAKLHGLMLLHATRYSPSLSPARPLANLHLTLAVLTFVCMKEDAIGFLTFRSSFPYPFPYTRTYIYTYTHFDFDCIDCDLRSCGVTFLNKYVIHNVYRTNICIDFACTT